MLKKICYILGIIIIILFVGLYAKTNLNNSPSHPSDDTEETLTLSTEFIDSNIIVRNNPEESSHITINRSTSPYKEFLTIPLYYQQDYKDVVYNNSTIASSGSLITCLSMLESYYCSDFITPREYVDMHYVQNMSTDELINDFATNNERNIIKLSFDAETLGNYLVHESREVLVQIPHPSIYGTPSSFILVTTTTADGKLYVRDPNQTNIATYASYSLDNEPLYNPTIFCEQASSSSYMYIFTEKPKGEKVNEKK